MKVVVKISGHLISKEEELIDYEYLTHIAQVLKKLKEQGNSAYVITGGGYTSRKYIHVARKLGANESFCDEVGIEIARVHARLLASALGEEAIPHIPTTIEEFVRLAFVTDKIVIAGGFQPGQSTTTVAALVAEAVGADLLIVTSDVDGIYTSDPKINPNAKKLDRVHIAQLEEMFRSQDTSAGLYKMIDPISLLVLRRSRIPTKFINGRPPENILKVLKGEKIGTEVYY